MAPSEEELARARYAYDAYQFDLVISEGRGYRVARSGHVLVIKVGLESLREDALDSALGETVASLLPLAPAGLEGDPSVYEDALCLYYSRLLREEAARLRRLFHGAAERLLLALAYPVAARASSLQRLYTWLRPLYTQAFSSHQYHSWLRGRLLRCLSGTGIKLAGGWIPASSLAAGRGEAGPLPATRLASATKMIIEFINPSLAQALPTPLLLEAVSAKPHPLLRDPLLLVRLDAARVATRLIPFDKQLYHLTGVARLLGQAKPSSKRSGVVRSAATLEIGGFKPAVVKRYLDVTAIKWLVAAIASLPLPKPILGSLRRLNNEYLYNRLLDEAGYPVPQPLLVDPRRRTAAYTYIEGMDLSAITKKEPSTPLYRNLGSLLASIHRDGYALWDTNPSNFVYSGSQLYLVDLEQARRSSRVEDRAFDVAIAVYYSLLYSARHASTRARLLAEGYLDAGGSPEVLAEAAKHKYMAPFLVAAPPQALDKARRTLLSAVQKQGGG